MIGQTIRSIRLGKGISQGDIQNSCGIKRCYLSRVENGKNVPGLPVLEKLASALKVHVADFFPDERVQKSFPKLSEKDINFLTAVNRHTSYLDKNDREMLLALVRKFSQMSKGVL